MSGELGFLLAVVVLGFVGLYWLLVTQLKKVTDRSPAELESVVDKMFGMTVSRISQQSREILQSEKELIKHDLEHKQLYFERLVKQLQDDMAKRQAEIRELERDRTQKFTQMATALDEHRKLTDELKVSTHQLASVLSNNQHRGEWGERIIEDLLQANGLVEGVHYARQTTLANSTLKPDITLLLPDQRMVPVDVKFPYAEIQKMSLTENKAAQQAHLKQFALDIKVKIKKVAQYIDPSHQTLDYAILFVPNEMVFTFINQKFPDLVDEALAQRVLIVSPFSFLIVARTIMESYRNFMIGDQLKQVVQYVDEFVKEWEKFRSKFEKYGRSLQTLQNDYEELTQTRVNQMERRIGNIRSVQQGSLLSKTKPDTGIVDAIATPNEDD